MNDVVLGTVVVAGTTSGICFLSTACCCLHSHHYIHQHSTTSQQSDAMASLAHKLVISPADMPPTVCRGYYSGEHVWWTTRLCSAIRVPFSTRFVIHSMLHEIQLVPVCCCSPSSNYGLDDLLHKLVSAVSSIIPELRGRQPSSYEHRACNSGTEHLRISSSFAACRVCVVLCTGLCDIQLCVLGVWSFACDVSWRAGLECSLYYCTGACNSGSCWHTVATVYSLCCLPAKSVHLHPLCLSAITWLVAQCGLGGIMCPWFDFLFWRYIYCLLVYKICFPTPPFFFTFSLFISSLNYLFF